mgnify:FL=1
MEEVKSNYRLSYDNLTDTLYVSVGDPSVADFSEVDDDFVCVRKNDREIVGITVDGYLDRHQDGSWNDSLILRYIPDIDIKDIKSYVDSSGH